MERLLRISVLYCPPFCNCYNDKRCICQPHRRDNQYYAVCATSCGQLHRRTIIGAPGIFVWINVHKLYYENIARTGQIHKLITTAQFLNHTGLVVKWVTDCANNLFLQDAYETQRCLGEKNVFFRSISEAYRDLAQIEIKSIHQNLSKMTYKLN